MLAKDPEVRISLEAAKSHPWFDSVDKSKFGSHASPSLKKKPTAFTKNYTLQAAGNQD